MRTKPLRNAVMTRIITICMDEKLFDLTAEAADCFNTSFSAIVREALRLYHDMEPL